MHFIRVHDKRLVVTNCNKKQEDIMSKVDLQENTASSGAKNKLKAKDLIFAGAFGAIYLVLMLIIVMGSGMIPILYFLSPLTVGLVCGTVYVLCVLKIRKFGAALILGVLFALVACSNGGFPSIAMGIGAALLAELILFLGKYRSRKMFLLSFVAFNLNMAAPFLMLVLKKDAFLQRSLEYYGESYANGINQVFFQGFYIVTLAFAIVGGIGGSLIANALVKKHFEKAGMV